MNLKSFMESLGVSEEVRRHIEECDKMYREAYGSLAEEPECNVCRGLLQTGFKITADNLPEICIRRCERWRLPGEGGLSPPELGVPEVDEQV